MHRTTAAGWITGFTGMDIFTDYKTDGAAKAVFMVAVFVLATATRGDWLLFFVYLSKNQLQNFFNVTNDQATHAVEVTNISREITHTSLLERCRLQNLPLFLVMSIGSSFIMYYGISFGFMWYFYINRRNQAKEWKCQPDKFLTPENERHEILLGSLNMFMGSALSGVIACYVMNGGYTTLYYNVSDYGWLYLIGSLVILFMYIECMAYYLHRLFHIPLLYKTIHKIHHRYHQPTAFSAVAMHPAEFFLHQSYLAVIPFLVPVHPVVYIGMLLYTYYYGLMDHSGIKMDALWPWQPPSLFHDNHHKYFHVNFGFNSYFFDWLHDTLRRNDRMYGEDIFYGHGKAIPSGTDVKKSQ